MTIFLNLSQYWSTLMTLVIDLNIYIYCHGNVKQIKHRWHFALSANYDLCLVQFYIFIHIYQLTLSVLYALSHSDVIYWQWKMSNCYQSYYVDFRHVSVFRIELHPQFELSARTMRPWHPIACLLNDYGNHTLSQYMHLAPLLVHSSSFFCCCCYCSIMKKVIL